MRVRMLTGLSGPAYALAPGDEHDFDQAEAIRLIEAGYAAPVEKARVERAVKKAPPERRG